MNHHVPVLLNRIVEFLNLPVFREREKIYLVDACFGEGGYTSKFLELDERIFVIGFEQDKELYNKVKNKFPENRVKIFNLNFIEFDVVFNDLGLNFANYFIFDLGISMYHIKESTKGIALTRDQPLDMRLSENCKYSAYDVINSFKEKDLADIFFKFGEEKFSKRIAKRIIDYRRKKKIKTTQELANIVKSVYPYRTKIHPATKVFQALRIFVNQELDNLKLGLLKSISKTIIDGRIIVVSYHSLEDRIVKSIFKEKEKEGEIKILTKKPIVPDYDEIKKNRSSRSAKMRVAQKLIF